jgi:putative heme-binding domain-containing protein
MYITIGGRRTQSGLYRVTYIGEESTKSSNLIIQRSGIHHDDSRKHLEAFHDTNTAFAVDSLWKSLGSEDRFVRTAARVAFEHHPVFTWAPKIANESNVSTKLTALLAFARSTAMDPLHAKADSPKAKPDDKKFLFSELETIDIKKLTDAQAQEYLRIYQIALNRFGAPEGNSLTSLTENLNKAFPTGNRFSDGMLLEILVYLQHPDATTKGLKLLANAPTQEEQLEYVRSLRMAKNGWTPELRKQYFEWFLKAANYKGGNSFQGFLRLIKEDAVAGLSDAEKTALKPILEAKPSATVTTAPPRPFVKKWTLAELTPKIVEGLNSGGRDFDKGRKLFAAVSCFACHRYDNEGGSNGPDLTGVAGRFSTKDLLESILDPSKEVSDQYGAIEIDTLDGKKVVGRIINLNGDNLMINTDMLNPNGIVTVNRNNIDTMKPSKLSMMPTGLFDTLTADEATDLMAYLMSRGDRRSVYFKN